MRLGLALAACLFVAAALSPMPPRARDHIATVSPAIIPVASITEEQPTPAGEPDTKDRSGQPGGAPERTRRLSVLLTGDVLLHEGLWATARADGGGERLDFRPLLAPMRPTIAEADLAVCHLETPLARAGGPFSAYPSFAAPPQIAPALRWAGYDACTTASNHTVDQGFRGLTRTLDRLDEAGLAHAGSYATRRDSRRPVLVDVAGVKVGLVAATYGLNGLPLPDGAPWSVDLLDVAQIDARARAARRAGADIVIVGLHWGTDGYAAVTADQQRVAQALTRSRVIDLVYGHHAHVVQPFDRVNGTWVLYGLGNAIAQQDSVRPELWEGVAARVTFVERDGGRFEVTRVGARPTLTTAYGAGPMRYLDVGRALRSPAWAHLRDRLLAARRDVLERVAALGAGA